jgi:CRISPR/Cas system-associated exonuclease Cas4 (RecB family)|tara:strand:+ start:1681 stop:2460 length:780 start_codon:yes stop_codon:yes gene_type:complete
MLNKINIEKIYSDYMDSKQEKNYEKRYKGKEGYYHGSASGFCSRKIYYQSIEKAEETNKPNAKSNRIMRLGTIVHEDFEKAFSLYNNNIYNKLIYNKDSNKKKNNIKEKQIEFLIENEIIIDELNVRGFYDLVVKCGGEVFLYDIKTMGSWPWKSKIAKGGTGAPSHHLQLATYGMAIKKEFGRLDGMYLLYYNKDNSDMRQIEVPMITLAQSENYWRNINEEHKMGLPKFKLGSSPVEEWNCSYCNYYDHCKPPYKKR